MNVKSYLSSAFQINRKIDNKLNRLEQFKQQSERGTSSYVARNISGTSCRSNVECGVEEIIELEYEIDYLVEELVKEKRKLRNEIMKVSEEVYQYILSERYVKFKSWEDIANKLNISFNEVISYHGYALNKFEQARIRGEVND